MLTQLMTDIKPYSTSGKLPRALALLLASLGSNRQSHKCNKRIDIHKDTLSKKIEMLFLRQLGQKMTSECIHSVINIHSTDNFYVKQESNKISNDIKFRD